MTLNVGQNFKKRWLNAPDAVRQSFLDDLNRISELLDPASNIQAWLDHDQRAMQISQLNIENAYAQLKAQLIEANRLRKQHALEKSLEEKRAKEQAYQQQLLQDELKQFQQQTVLLKDLSQHIEIEVSEYSNRYSRNPDQPAIDYSRGQFLVSDSEIITELDTIRLRLELEAETQIEKAVSEFRDKLMLAAKDEIEYILKNTEIVNQ